MPQVADLIGRYGDDRKLLGVDAAHSLQTRLGAVPTIADIPGPERVGLRNDAYRVLAELETVGSSRQACPKRRARAEPTFAAQSGGRRSSPTLPGGCAS